MIVTEAYARAVGMEDHLQVDAKEIVKLFARKVSLEEFAAFVNRTLPKQQRYVPPPTPYKAKQAVMRQNNLMQMQQVPLMSAHNLMHFQAPFEVHQTSIFLWIAFLNLGGKY